MLEYRTAAKEVSSEIIVKKSRFIAHVKPVQDEAEANEFIRQINKHHREATHNVYAYRISEQQEKCNDDGEPSGTAGKPVLNVIKGENLYNIVVVVTRYYGGILLGAGGLVRAYTQSVSQGISEAGVITRVLYQRMQVAFAMPLFGLIKRVMENYGAKIMDVQVTDKGVIVVRLPVAEAEGLISAVVETSAGKAEIELLGEEFV